MGRVPASSTDEGGKANPRELNLSRLEHRLLDWKVDGVSRYLKKEESYIA